MNKIQNCIQERADAPLCLRMCTSAGSPSPPGPVVLICTNAWVESSRIGISIQLLLAMYRTGAECVSGRYSICGWKHFQFTVGLSYAFNFFLLRNQCPENLHTFFNEIYPSSSYANLRVLTIYNLRSIDSSLQVENTFWGTAKLLTNTEPRLWLQNMIFSE